MNENIWQFISGSNKNQMKDQLIMFDQKRRMSNPEKYEGSASYSGKRERKYSDQSRYPPNSPSKRMSFSHISQNKNLYKDQDAFLSTLLNRSHVKHRLLPPLDYEPTGIIYSSKGYQQYKYQGPKQPVSLQHTMMTNAMYYNNEYDDESDMTNNSKRNISPKISKIKIKVKTSRTDSLDIDEAVVQKEPTFMKATIVQNEGLSTDFNQNYQLDDSPAVNEDWEISRKISSDENCKSFSPRMKLPRSSLTNIPKKDSISEESIQHNLSILQKFEELRQESKKKENFCNCKLHNHQHNHTDSKPLPPPPKPAIKTQIIPRRKPSITEKPVVPKKTKSHHVKPTSLPPPIVIKEPTEIEKEINIQIKDPTPAPSPLPDESSDSELEAEPECEIKSPEVVEDSVDEEGAEEEENSNEENLPRRWLPPKTPNPLKGARMCLDSLKQSKEELVKTFRKIDRDMDGYVNFHQIKPEIPSELTQSEIYFVKEIFDITDGSTFFGLQEFILFMILCQKICSLDGPVREAYNVTKDLDLRDVLTEFVAKFQTNETEPMSGISIDAMFDILFEMRGDVQTSSVPLFVSQEITEEYNDNAHVEDEIPFNSNNINDHPYIEPIPVCMDNDRLYTYIYEELRLWMVSTCIDKLDYISYLPFFISVCPNLQVNRIQKKARNILQ